MSLISVSSAAAKSGDSFRLVDVKSDERQEGMVARTAYRLNQSMGIAEQMVNMIRARQSVPVP